MIPEPGNVHQITRLSLPSFISDRTLQMQKTFCGRLVAAAEQRPDKIAMTLLGAQRCDTTFGDMLSQIKSIAFRLIQEQVARGDRVALIGENHPNWAIAYLGVLYRGAVVVPLDPAATIETLANFLDNSQTKLAFIASSADVKFQQVCEHLGRPIRAVKLISNGDSDGQDTFDQWARTKVTAEFLDAPSAATAEDMALLIYTSGTTGIPKAVPLTHGNIHAEVEGVQEVMKLSDREVILSLLPLFHAYSQIVNLWLATVIGARVVYLPEVTPESIARALRDAQVTALTGVPRLWYLFHKKILEGVQSQPRVARAIFRHLLNLNGWLRDSVGVNVGRLVFRRVHRAFGGRLRLAVSAGSSFDAEVARDYHRLGFTILQGYGLTETAGAATVTRFEDNKIGSVGTPLNNAEVKIDKPDGEGIGEVLIRGPIVMQGYYQNPEANSEAFTADGWFRSGDLGRFDPAGHLYIVGRKKDVIVLASGKNVYPEDVEAHYTKSPLVSELCVLGVKQRDDGFASSETLCAVVVPDFEYLKRNSIANAREAIRYDLDNRGRDLPEYQRVRNYVVQAEPLPRTATRKVRRFELQRQLESLQNGKARIVREERFVCSEADRKLLNTAAGKELVQAIMRHAPEASTIHPQMNLELDLGLDSLARAECLSSLEQAFGLQFDDEEAARALTVADVLALTNSGNGSTRASALPATEKRLTWAEILAVDPSSGEELQPLLHTRHLTAFGAFVLLNLVYALARIFLGLQVSGVENLRYLKAPFIVSPNHQSYIDPVLVCSVYPYRVLSKIFHVGASEYWRNSLTKQIAKMINIVPVDPDTNLRRALWIGATGLRAGKVLNIYPEGERSFDGELHPFKKGAAILASELQVPILPVALDGVYKVWPRKSWRLRLAKVRIRFGEPIYPAGVPAEGQAEELTVRLRSTIQKMLSEMREIK